MNTGKIDQLLKFLATTPGDSFLRFALALEYIKIGDDQKALSYFKEIITSDPGYTGTYYHLGKLYEKLKVKDTAEQTYREGMKRTLGKDQKTYNELQEAINQLLYEE